MLVFPDFEGVTLSYYGVSASSATDLPWRDDSTAGLQADEGGSWLVF